MKTRTDKIYIPLTVPRRIINQYEGPYFFEKGVEMEDHVQENEVKDCVSAQFDGFEVLNDFQQAELLEQSPEEPSITAKLFYFVEIKTD
ncbi:MAG: hypothetical protein ACTIJ2_13900 [Sphingobacteriaceae bacterium]